MNTHIQQLRDLVRRVNNGIRRTLTCTTNTTPEKTLQAFAEHGRVSAVLPVDGGDAERVLEKFRREGVEDEALTSWLQRGGLTPFRHRRMRSTRALRTRARSSLHSRNILDTHTR